MENVSALHRAYPPHCGAELRVPGTLAQDGPVAAARQVLASSVVASLSATLANMASLQLSELFYGSGIYFEMQLSLCVMHISLECLATGSPLL